MKLHTLLQFCRAWDKDGRNLVHGLPFTPGDCRETLARSPW